MGSRVQSSGLPFAELLDTVNESTRGAEYCLRSDTGNYFTVSRLDYDESCCVLSGKSKGHSGRREYCVGDPGRRVRLPARRRQHMSGEAPDPLALPWAVVCRRLRGGIPRIEAEPDARGLAWEAVKSRWAGRGNAVQVWVGCGKPRATARR